MKLKSILEMGILLGSAIIIAVVTSLAITAYLGGSSHPTVAVTTGSMLPIYNGFQDGEFDDIYPFRGDILLVKKVPIDSIEIGDVIVFETPSVPDPVVHRVIDKWSENDTYYFKTNGDNRNDPDNWSVYHNPDPDDEKHKIYGVVVVRIPHLGWFLLVIQTTLGRLIVLAIAIILLFIGDSEEEKEETEKNKKKQKFFTRKKVYFTLILTILSVFMGINFINAFLSTPTVTLYSYNLGNGLIIENLLESNDSNPYSLTLPSQGQYKWPKGDNSSFTAVFFPIKIEIRSGGILNNIDRLDIKTNVNGSVGTYTWTTVYNFIGVRIFEGGIKALMTSNGTYNASVTLDIYSRGLMASSFQSIDFSLVLLVQSI